MTWGWLLGFLKWALPSSTRMEHSESKSMRNLVWEYPMSLGSLINDTGLGQEKRKKESIIVAWMGWSVYLGILEMKADCISSR